MTLGEKIDKLFELREKKLKAKEIVSDIQKDFDIIQIDIISHMQAEDVKAVKGIKASASISIGFYPGVEDLELFANWVVKNGKYEMMQKRVSSAAIKEMLDSTNKLPPGVKSYTEPKLNLRRI